MGCDDTNKIYLSEIIYDCSPFVCAGFPELSLEPCDKMCDVINVIMSTLCEFKNVATPTAGISTACIETNADYECVPGPYSAANNVTLLTFTIVNVGDYNISVTLNSTIDPNDNTTYQVYVDGAAVGIPYSHVKDSTDLGTATEICHFETCKSLVSGNVVTVGAIAGAVGRGTKIGSCNLFIQRVN